ELRQDPTALWSGNAGSKIIMDSSVDTGLGAANCGPSKEFYLDLPPIDTEARARPVESRTTSIGWIVLTTSLRELGCAIFARRISAAAATVGSICWSTLVKVGVLIRQMSWLLNPE